VKLNGVLNIMTKIQAERPSNRGLILWAGVRGVFVQSVETGFGNHLVSYSEVNGFSFAGGDAAGV
jgi:hypothetical protein